MPGEKAAEMGALITFCFTWYR